jgi:hypothetical protein
MKKQVLFTVMFTVAIMLSFRADSFGQLLLNENFDYVAGTQIIANGWSQTGSVVTNPMLVSNGGLSYTGYLSSGVGNAASLITSGQDVNQTFTSQASGTLYAGFLVSVSASQTAGDYFIHFTQTGSSTIFKGRVFIKKDPSSSNFAFGISKSSTSTIAYTGYTYSLNTTYLVVLKYQFNSGTTQDDDVSLYINPPLNAPEPGTPTISYIDNTQGDATSLGIIGLRQGTASNSATLWADGIRIGQTWADIVGIAPVPTLSQWGLIFLGLALLGAGTLFIVRMKG